MQTGDPRQVFNLPQEREVAEFVGTENILPGVIASSNDGIVTVPIGGAVLEAISDLQPGQEVCACIRPEEITLARTRETTSARNAFPSRIIRIVVMGPLARVEMDCGFPLVALDQADLWGRVVEDSHLSLGATTTPPSNRT